MIKAIFVVGPTASGKTAVGIELAKKFDGEVVSADSMQIYKGIHIASAAPNESEKCGIPHHLIEFLETDSEFSVADYVIKARETINDMASRGKLPIIVGGTGLYVSALLDNIEFLDQPTNADLRAELEEKFDSIGAETMLAELAEFDPDTAKRLHPNNRRRIIRAFEVYILSGRTISQQNAISRQNAGDITPLVIGLNYADRELLYDRINLRVDMMIEQGLLEEAKTTYQNSGESGAFQAIGHKELYPYFNGECSLEDAVEHLKMQTRRYAKRQLTWFRKIDSINWFYPDNGDVWDAIFDITQKFIEEE